MALAESISRVFLVDDQPQSRKSYGYTVENADLEPVSEDGPLGTLDDYLAQHDARVRARADAALCDYQLGTRAYASFTGAELVKRWYQIGFPAMLCTRYEKVHIERIRPYRRWIPVLITPDDLNVDSLLQGLDRCISELQGNFESTRRPWRTQIHFLDQDSEQQGTFIAEIPGWELSEVIRIRLKDIPVDVASHVRPDFRCHARVNLGAETAEELFVCDWEER